MTTTELAKEVAKWAKEHPNTEVGFVYNTSDCTGHGPDERCYCGYSDHWVGISYLCKDTHNEQGKPRKKPVITIHGD